MNRPLLRYHGGKWLIAPWIIQHMPAHRVYTEAFGGGGSVLLRKAPAYVEIYNDLDGELVNLFRVVRDQGQQLKELLRLTPYARAEFDLSYEPAECTLERARRTLVRSYMGFGASSILGGSSGFRPNSKGDAIPARSWKTYPEALDSIIERMRGVIIENKPALEVIAQHDSPVTLHYVDPPYVFATRGKRGAGQRPKHCYRHELDDSDHVELAEFLKGLKGGVILSGYNCPLYEELYAGWHRADLATKADGAAKRTESLWLSPNIPAIGRLI